MELPSKPSEMFDRDDEWNDLARFAVDDAAGATLGVVSGRRRQGKTLLLYSLAQATDGLYFAATTIGSSSRSSPFTRRSCVPPGPG